MGSQQEDAALTKMGQWGGLRGSLESPPGCPARGGAAAWGSEKGQTREKQKMDEGVGAHVFPECIEREFP